MPPIQLETLLEFDLGSPIGQLRAMPVELKIFCVSGRPHGRATRFRRWPSPSCSHRKVARTTL